MKATTGCVLLTCQSLVLYGLLLTCQREHMFPTKPSLRSSLDGALGGRVLVPDAPIVFRSTDDATELYRLRADGTEWYAPGVDRAWIQGVLFQARCLVQTRCL